VVNALDANGEDKLPVVNSPAREKLANCLESFNATLEASGENVALKEI
jgi:hypothetical protein